MHFLHACFRCRQERVALARLAISAACSQLSQRRPCSEGWMSALQQGNVIHAMSGRKSWRDGSREGGGGHPGESKAQDSE